MIYVRIELWPGGDKDHPRAQVIGEAEIWNDGKGTSTTASYGYRLRGKNSQPMGSGTVHGFQRKRKMAWDILKLILNDARK